MMAPAEGDGHRGRLSRLLGSRAFRFAVSFLLLAVLLSRLDRGQLASTLAHVRPGLLLLGTLVFLVANLVSIYKWRLVIDAQGDRVSFFRLTRIFYIGLFFNNFLPTNFGGDVIKAFKLARETGHGADAAGSVALDRAGSIFALLLIALPPALLELRLLGTTVAIVVPAMIGCFLLLVLVAANDRVARRLGRLLPAHFDPFGTRRHLKSFYYSLHSFRDHKRMLAALLLVSLAYQGLQIVTVWVLALSLGIETAPVYYFIFIPVVLAVSMIPVSLNGLGVREGAWVLLFSRVGVPAAAAFSMSILSLLVMTVVSLAGGVFYMLEGAAPMPGGDPSAAGEGERGHP